MQNDNFKKPKILSHRQLIWRKFKRNKLGLIGAIIVIILTVISIFAPFFSPYNYTATDSEAAYRSYQAVHFFEQNGKFHLQPFVYSMKQEFDEQTWERVYIPDRTKIYPIKLFYRGWEYKLFGLIKSDLHLFGVDKPAEIHFFGTDELGRDLLSRIIFGGRVSIAIAIIGSMLTALIGSIVGGISGYFAGKVDNILQRLIELIRMFPTLPLMMALSAAIPVTWSPVLVLIAVMFIMIMVRWTDMARQIRGKVLSYREQEYVDAARAAGANDLYIIIKHVLSNCTSHIIVVTTLAIPQLILAESSLSFLGLGIQPPMVSWGVLLSKATNLQTIGQYPWIMTPGVVILLTILAFNFLGDGLRDAADPYGR
ncbi:ABC transporter permease [Halanaerobium salsuginis]|jgi:peptide/nickel transport system permease protein|uniref:Peptide/nickel transport system permease protein n=1 Tax=Halanaerobium salsuginis TaxID=29563 RepID=A0A1I4GMJ7_9FIRM|nr:ABC transporter permease [Halanaerobium salsuginis]SFL31195.1 peptide/nickel transport system permease protein [Halanaerobium salsuginis]